MSLRYILHESTVILKCYKECNSFWPNLVKRPWIIGPPQSYALSKYGMLLIWNWFFKMYMVSVYPFKKYYNSVLFGSVLLYSQKPGVSFSLDLFCFFLTYHKTHALLQGTQWAQQCVVVHITTEGYGLTCWGTACVLRLALLVPGTSVSV